MFEEPAYAYADSTFLELFSFRLLQGRWNDQLRRPATVLLTESAAEKYFGRENPIGKTLLINNKREFEVTGVLEDMPLNTHVRFNMLMSMSTLAFPSDEQWDSPNYITYLELAKGTVLETFQQKVNTEWLSDNQYVKLEFQELGDLHFDTSINPYVIRITDARYLILFTIVAVLILIIACINYVNLVTARANERGREVGIRKVSGASFGELFFQFMTDSFLHVLPAAAGGLVLFFALFPWIKSFLELQLPPFTEDDCRVISLVVVVLLIVITVFAGIYPSVVMTRFRPVSILKGKFQTSQMASSFRKGLVVFQFAISIVLIICAMVVSAQLEFLQHKKLGFDKENILMLPADATLNNRFDAFRTELKKLPFIMHFVPVSSSPLNVIVGYGAQLSEKSEDFTTVGALQTNSDFLSAMNIRLLAGRNFDDHQTSSEGELQFLVNQTFLTKYGFTQEEVLGKPIWLGIAGGAGKIIGVVSDFHIGSLHKKIEPLVIYSKGDFINQYLVRLLPGNVQEQLAEMEKVWKDFAPHRPFTWSFLDEYYNRLYANEIQINKLIHIFSGLAIIIACLGILGLASYSATQRAKEISIRKVLGAGTGDVVILLAKGFLSPVFIGFCIAIPFAWFITDDWLSYFEYRISMDTLPFIIGGLVALGFALLTILFQTIRAARVNPAETLKTE